MAVHLRQSHAQLTLLRGEPPPTGDERWDILLAALAEHLAAGHDAGPPWAELRVLRRPWPIEPRNLVRSFRRICDDNKIRIITVHHLRHTVASLLKDLGVPARDAQAILGHTRISTTPGDLHRCQRPGPARRAHPATWPARRCPGLTRCYRT